MFIYSINLIIRRILINEWITQGLYMDKNKNMDQLTRNYRKIFFVVFMNFAAYDKEGTLCVTLPFFYINGDFWFSL